MRSAFELDGSFHNSGLQLLPAAVFMMTFDLPM